MSDLSIYCSAFNLIQNQFQGWKDALLNFSLFGDEVVVCVNKSEDNTLDEIFKYKKEKNLNNLFIITSDYSYDDLAFDGKIKNDALQATRYDGKILLDLDERINLDQKDLWTEWSKKIQPWSSSYGCFDGLMISSINLCGSMNTFKDIGYKFYLHTNELKRGIINQAKLDNGKINIKMSDTTEPILKNGNLGRFYRLSNNIEELRLGKVPYVYHLWGVDKEARIRQNQTWQPVWENRAGYKITDIELNKENLDKIPVFEHGLLVNFHN